MVGLYAIPIGEEPSVQGLYCGNKRLNFLKKKQISALLSEFHSLILSQGVGKVHH
jgi:hypothetical protein